MAELPRLNGVIRALEAGQHALTCFAPAELNTAIAMSAVEIRRLRLRDGASAVGRPAVAGLPAIHAQPRADRQSRVRRAGRDADGPRAGERRRDGAVAGQAGPRHGLLRHRVPAHFDGRGSRQCGRRLPLSAAEKRAALRARRHPRRRPDRGRALLGAEPAGLLPEGRRLAAQSAGRNFLHPADRGHARRGKPRRHPRRTCRASAAS